MPSGEEKTLGEAVFEIGGVNVTERKFLRSATEWKFY